MIAIRVGEFAEMLGVHRNTVRNWIKSGALAACSVAGKKYLIEEEEFRQFCALQKIPENVVSRLVSEEPQAGGGKEKSMPQSASVGETRMVGERRSVLRADPHWVDLCLTCGSCASACPISGIDGLDPRKIIRMIALGRTSEVIDSAWPWKCTLCGKCEEACPMNLELVKLFRRIRSLRERDKVPGPLHKGVLMALRRGNNLGIPKADFVDLLEEVGEELAEESCPGFVTPVDVEGANLLLTVNSKEPFGEPDDMKFWWKIFYAAGESWTIPSENWEGVNWGLFTGDDDAMRVMVGRIVDNMLRLDCKKLVLPE